MMFKKFTVSSLVATVVLGNILTPVSYVTGFTMPTTPQHMSKIPTTTLYASSSVLDTSSLLLYGHPGTRSPLINWACCELGFDITVAADLSRNPHPFGQLPCLTDKENVVVFESGAILLYLQQWYSSNIQPPLSDEQNAAITSWITWANASLDPICFLETPNGKVYDTGLRQPNRRIDQLNTMLSNQSYLVSSSDGTNSIFTIADVAIVSYLAYVLQFFPDVTIADKWPAIALYMQSCISRPSYGQAFTSTTQNRLLKQLENDIGNASTTTTTTGGKDKKLFGMF